jgi:hypothetical protein
VGATVDLEDALPPSPLATAFDEPNNLPDDVAVHQKGDEGTLSSPGTVFAAANHQQSQPSISPYSTSPSGERYTTNDVQRLDFPHPPNVFQQDDFTYHDRLRNGEQLQDGLMTEPYTEEQDVAAIDNLIGVGSWSLYSDAIRTPFQCQLGWNDEQGTWVCWHQSCACRMEHITTQYIDSAYPLGQLQGPAEGQQEGITQAGMGIGTGVDGAGDAAMQIFRSTLNPEAPDFQPMGGLSDFSGREEQS